MDYEHVYRAATGDLAPDGGGDLAAAVHAFFDRAGAGLPTFVSAMPSIYVSVAIVLVPFVQGAQVVRDEYQRSRVSEDAVTRMRWIVLLAVLVGVCGALQSVLQERLYHMHNIARNKQHFANAHWARAYVSAMR